MKRILVPSDLSELSEIALQMAVDLAKFVNGEIFLINFTRHPVGATFTATGEIDKKYPDEENLYTINVVSKFQEQLAQQAARYYSSATQINYQVYDDELKDGVAEFINNNQIDLVVMGTSGEESADEFFTGNHTQQVIEVATCPVISLTQPFNRTTYERIILGLNTDTDRHDNFRQAAKFLMEISRALGAETEVVHVVDPGTDSIVKRQEELEALMVKIGLANQSVTIIEHEDKIEGLLGFARERSAGFLAVFTHADDSLFRIFRSSLSGDLTMASDIPIITINLHTI